MNKKFLKIIAICILFFSLSSSALAQNEKDEANSIFKSGVNLNEFLKNNKKTMNVKDQIYAMKKYTEPLIKGIKEVKISDKYVINNFIVYGTQSTSKLTAQKRYELIKLHKTKYKKLPTNQADWENLLKLNNNIKSPTKNTKAIKIKLFNGGKIITKEITQEEFDKYQVSLSVINGSEKEIQTEQTAFPPDGYKLEKNVFGRETKDYKSSNAIKFSSISGVYIVNVLTPEKDNVQDFSSFPLELTIDYSKTTSTETRDKTKFSIFYWAGDSVCSEKGCGYYVSMPTNINDNTKQAKVAITVPGQYILGIKK